MKTPMLPIVSIGLLLSIPDTWCEAAPGPPHLSELATLKTKQHGFGLRFSPDGKTLFSLDSGSIWFWDVVSRKHTTTLEYTPEIGSIFRGMAWSPDGKTIARGYGKTIILWDLASRKEIATLKEDEQVESIVFSPDSKTLSVGIRTSRTERDGLRIWDVKKRERVRSYNKSGFFLPVTADRAIKKPLWAIQGYYPRRFPSPKETAAFTLIDAFTGDTALTCEWNTKEGRMPMYFALNRDETMVASAGPGSPVHLWDRKLGKSIAIFKDFALAHGGLVFSPDGKILAASYQGDQGKMNVSGLRLYAVPSGKILADLKERVGFDSLAFSPGGQLLAIGGFREIKLWSIPEQWSKEDK